MLKMPKRLRKIGIDFGLNLIANVLYIAVLQLIVYPSIAYKCDADSYGRFLTIMGIITTAAGTFGNSLNNVRLIMNEEYSREKICGDFNIFLLGALLINSIITIIFALLFHISFLSFLPLLLLVSISIIRNYISVEFRLKINYRKILLMNIILSVGYIIGIIWYKNVNVNFEYWIMVFLFAEILAFIYLVKETRLFKEPLQRTVLFNKSFRKYNSLIYLSFIASALLYFDRNLLLPLLGGSAVSVYFAATVVGKATSLIASPMSSVLLSYYAQVDFEMTRKRFWLINKTICLTSVITYIGTVIVVDKVVGFLYPSLYSEAKQILYLANIVPILNVIADMARPAVVRYVSLNKLSVFQTGFLIVTCAVSYFAISWKGLVGFCYGAIVLAVIKIIAMWMLGDTALRHIK